MTNAGNLFSNGKILMTASVCGFELFLESTTSSADDEKFTTVRPVSLWNIPENKIKLFLFTKLKQEQCE